MGEQRQPGGTVKHEEKGNRGRYLDRYLGELEWRLNDWENEHICRDTLARIVCTGALPYRELVA